MGERNRSGSSIRSVTVQWRIFRVNYDQSILKTIYLAQFCMEWQSLVTGSCRYSLTKVTSCWRPAAGKPSRLYWLPKRHPPPHLNRLSLNLIRMWAQEHVLWVMPSSPSRRASWQFYGMAFRIFLHPCLFVVPVYICIVEVFRCLARRCVFLNAICASCKLVFVHLGNEDSAVWLLSKWNPKRLFRILRAAILLLSLPTKHRKMNHYKSTPKIHFQ